MEIGKKIQVLRKENNLTQEQLAEQLFVSRTAVSKWETGRGLPNMESLMLISKLFHITLDELLSSEEIALIAEKENKENISRFASYIDGIFNIIAILSLLFPLYKAKLNGAFYSVPLYQFKSAFAVLYWIFPISMALCGVIQILFYKSEQNKIQDTTTIVGISINICAILALILSGQPYPAIMFFALLLIKGAVMLKKHQ